jgi:hypothetical protein
MYNNGNSSKNVTGASVVDSSLENADFADNGLSGDKIDGGIISNFQSTGIDDRNAAGKTIYVDSAKVGVNVSSPSSILDLDSGSAGQSSADKAAIKVTGQRSGNIHGLILQHEGSNGSTTSTDTGAGVQWKGHSNGSYYTMGAIYVRSGGTVSSGDSDGYMSLFTTPAGSTTLQEGLRIESDGDTRPGADNSHDIGTSSYRWEDVYATNGTIQTSDERQKDNITPSTLGLDFIKALNPVAYKWKNYTSTVNVDDVEAEVDENGNAINQVTKEVEHTFTRTHYGMIAQEVEAALNGSDFAGLIYDEESDRYGLRYTEFVAPLIKAVQEQQATIEALTTRIEQLENI